MTSKDIVSKDVAKFLKKRSFTEQTYWYYMIYGDEASNYGYEFNHNEYDDEYSAPTLQKTLKWLREVHNVLIFPRWVYNNGNTTITYGYTVYKVFPLSCEDHSNRNIWYDSYEEAIDEGIKYALENIIN